MQLIYSGTFHLLNPLVPIIIIIAHKSVRIVKISILK